jgi:hypothetical protein
VRLTSEAFEKLEKNTGEQEWGALFIRVGFDADGKYIALAPLEDLMQTDLRDGRYVQVEATTLVDHVALESLGEDAEGMDPADWPTEEGYRITDIGRALPGYVSGEEYFPNLDQLVEYLDEDKEMGVLVDSDNWFAMVFEQEVYG